MVTCGSTDGRVLGRDVDTHTRSLPRLGATVDRRREFAALPAGLVQRGGRTDA